MDEDQKERNDEQVAGFYLRQKTQKGRNYDNKARSDYQIKDLSTSGPALSRSREMITMFDSPSFLCHYTASLSAIVDVGTTR